MWQRLNPHDMRGRRHLHAAQAARERLSPAEESRLLVLIRSANDSADDVMSYLERAHGFLSKARGCSHSPTCCRGSPHMQ